MSDEKVIHLSVADDTVPPKPDEKPRRRKPKPPLAPGGAEPGPEAPPQPPDIRPSQPAAPPPWHQFVRTADVRAISRRFAEEARSILEGFGAQLSEYCLLALLDSDTLITGYDLDRISSALSRLNSKRDKSVLLFLLTPGGSIEPAYQISKLCKSFAKDRFVVAVPRQAKSAGTLLAIGADEIHMGPLGHLGPIDPQLGGLPALGVSQALKSIAEVAQQFPGSADMFSRYLNMALTVEQIGYCERISESAAQYAERLLAKKSLPKPAKSVANELVHEYKDHGFVIDLDEAWQHLGNSWVKTATVESNAAEELYVLFDEVNLFLNVHRNKRLLVLGGLEPSDVLVFDRPQR